MQALALLHWTMRDHEWSSRLVLDGRIFRLGTVADVNNRVHGRRCCEISVENEDAWFQWQLEGERDEVACDENSSGIAMHTRWSTMSNPTRVAAVSLPPAIVCPGR